MFRQDFSCPALLEDHMSFYLYGAITLYCSAFHPVLVLNICHWPGPRSLATTNGVSVDVLSSGYLDVSVPRVRFITLCIQVTIPHMRWVSPFGNLRIKGYSHLPVAYRSVSRPSSPLSAKASIKCSFALVLDTQMSDTRNCFAIPGVRNQESGIRLQENSQTAFSCSFFRVPNT